MAKSWLQKYATYEEEVVASAVGITAFATGGQGSATQLLKKFNSIDTVVTANDSVKLVPALIGKVQGVFNNTANDLTVYPATGEYIDGTINNGLTIDPGDYVEFRAYASGRWDSYAGSPVGAGTVTSASVVSANGFAGSVATASTTPAITISTTVTGIIKGNGTAMSAATSGTDYSLGTSALATGIIKSTTGTGAFTIAVAGDFPTLNQSTTGTASNVTGVVAIVNGGTGQATSTLGFNAISPLTTRGDIIVRGATNNQRLAIGAAGTILRNDGTDVVWSTANYPTVTASNQILFSTATNVIGGSATFLTDGTYLFVGQATATGLETFGFRKDQNAGTIMRVHNNTSGTAGKSSLIISGPTGIIQFNVLSNGFTPLGSDIADGSSIVSTSPNGFNVGSYSNSQFSFWTNNTQRIQVSSSGHLLWITDNSLDIGASGATRPRRIYVGTQIITPSITVGTPPTYTISNVTTDRSYDANSTSIDEVADALGTLVADLRGMGLVL